MSVCWGARRRQSNRLCTLGKYGKGVFPPVDRLPRRHLPWLAASFEQFPQALNSLPGAVNGSKWGDGLPVLCKFVPRI
jgi:hypothetical protein